MSTSSAVASLLVLAACGSGVADRDVAQPRDLRASSDAPVVSRVIDLGELSDIPARGALPTDGADGVFTPGELVLIEGDDFGKQPAVRVGGEPSEVLSRTGGGGIVSRVPTGVAAGQVAVEVSHPGGRGERLVPVRRHVIAANPSGAHLLSLGHDGALTYAVGLDLRGVRAVAFSGDGRAAYLALDPSLGAERAAVAVVAVGARGGPALRRELPIDAEAIVDLVSAPSSPVVAVVTSAAVVVLDTREATVPTVAATVILGERPVAAAMAPDGRRMVLLSAASDRITLVDLGDAGAPRVTATAFIGDGSPVALVREVAFAPGGDEAWVLAGDDRESIAAGAHPTSLLVVSLEDGKPRRVRKVEIDGAGAPTALAVSRDETALAASAIRSTAGRARIVVASENRALVRPDPGFSVAGLAELGSLVDTDLDGRSEVVAAGKAIYRDLAMTRDLRFVLGAGSMFERNGDRTEARFGVTVVPLQGGSASSVTLGDGEGATLLSPAALAIAP